MKKLSEQDVCLELLINQSMYKTQTQIVELKYSKGEYKNILTLYKNEKYKIFMKYLNALGYKTEVNILPLSNFSHFRYFINWNNEKIPHWVNFIYKDSTGIYGSYYKPKLKQFDGKKDNPTNFKAKYYGGESINLGKYIDDIPFLNLLDTLEILERPSFDYNEHIDTNSYFINWKLFTQQEKYRHANKIIFSKQAYWMNEVINITLLDEEDNILFESKDNEYNGHKIVNVNKTFKLKNKLMTDFIFYRKKHIKKG